MSDEIRDTAEAVKGIVAAVPIYEDLLRPTIKELGKGLHTLSKTIHIALAPVSALVWSYEQIKAYIQPALEERLKNIPQERIVPPDPSVAGPALEALRYSGHKEDLREMYANLLATAMDSKTVSQAHPAFVEIIKQLCPDEAKILKLLTSDQSFGIVTIRACDDKNHYSEPLRNFSILPDLAQCTSPQLGNSYLENITRLGLSVMSYSSYCTLENAYGSYANHPIILHWKQQIEAMGKRPEIKQGVFMRTPLGAQFYEACVIQK